MPKRLIQCRWTNKAQLPIPHSPHLHPRALALFARGGSPIEIHPSRHRLPLALRWPRLPTRRSRARTPSSLPLHPPLPGQPRPRSRRRRPPRCLCRCRSRRFSGWAVVSIRVMFGGRLLQRRRRGGARVHPLVPLRVVVVFVVGKTIGEQRGRDIMTGRRGVGRVQRTSGEKKHVVATG